MTAAPGSGRTVTIVETVPPLGSRQAAAGWLGGLLLGYAAYAVAAAVPSAWALAVAALAVIAVELAVPHRLPAAEWVLGRVAAGPELRSAVRGLLLVLFAARAAGGGVLVATAAAALAVLALHLLRRGLVAAVGHLRQPPVLSRGLPLDALRIPPAPAGWLTEPRGIAGVLELPAAAGLVLAATGAGSGVAYAGLAAAVLAAAVPAGLLAAAAATLRRDRIRDRVPAEIGRQLAELRPEVVLYFGGGPDAAYQVETWLEPVEALGRQALVVIRDRRVLAGLAPTALPAICVPHGATLMALELPSLQAALYVSNASGNIHLLRRRGVWSVFIGHGDSDKAASSNPFSRAYDEIWVAGPAGRDRYLDAGIGVDPERIVVVGRPQLAAASPPTGPDAAGIAMRARGTAGRGVSVLYAPTWEGWGDEPHATSLSSIGPDLVGALLATPGVRVLYRPHPLTGARNAAVRRGHDEVVRRLRQAGAAGPEVAPAPPAKAVPQPGDLLDRARSAPSWSRAEHRAAQAAWTRAYWAAVDGSGHRILSAPAPDIYSCFAQADVLVADVSSVTTDFLPFDRPYAVLNVAGLPEAEFRARYPSATGGVVVGPDLAELAAVLAAAAGPDPTVDARRAVRRRLLGPADPDPAARFAAALERLCTVPPAHDTSRGAAPAANLTSG